MKNFPSEYLFITKDGDSFFKRYSEKKKEVEITPYTLASTPVIFDKGATVETIFKLIEKNPCVKTVLYYPDEFLAESKEESKAKDINGKLRFQWDYIETDLDYFHVNYPKMEVDGIDENGEAFGIEFLTAADIKHLELTFDNTLHIINEKGKEVVTLHTHPTLFQIIYGLFWEMSFFGNPEQRDAEGKVLLETISKIKK